MAFRFNQWLSVSFGGGWFETRLATKESGRVESWARGWALAGALCCGRGDVQSSGKSSTKGPG